MTLHKIHENKHIAYQPRSWHGTLASGSLKNQSIEMFIGTFFVFWYYSKSIDNVHTKVNEILILSEKHPNLFTLQLNFILYIKSINIDNVQIAVGVNGKVVACSSNRSIGNDLNAVCAFVSLP